MMSERRKASELGMTRAGAHWGRLLLTLLLAAVVWAAPQQLYAKPPAAGQGDKRAAAKRGKNKPAAKRRARIRSKRARLLRKRLGLDEARARKVEALFDEHAAAKKKSRREMRTARRAVAKLLRQDSDDQDAYRAALDRLSLATSALVTLRRDHIKRLRTVLTPKEQARLMRMMARAARHMRRAARRR